MSEIYGNRLKQLQAEGKLYFIMGCTRSHLNGQPLARHCCSRSRSTYSACVTPPCSLARILRKASAQRSFYLLHRE